jgi:hypothetical protein
MGKIFNFDNNIEELFNEQKKRITDIFIRFNCCHCNNSVKNNFYDSYFDEKLFCGLNCKLSYYQRQGSFKKLINKVLIE